MFNMFERKIVAEQTGNTLFKNAIGEIETDLNNVNLQSKAHEILEENWKQEFENKFKNNPYYSYHFPNDDIIKKKPLVKLITDYRKHHGMITIQEARTIAIKEINDCLNGQDSMELNYLSPIVEITNNELERSNQTWEKQIEQATNINEIDQIKDRVIANINKIGFSKRKQLQIMDYSYGDLIKRRQCFTYDDIYYVKFITSNQIVLSSFLFIPLPIKLWRYFRVLKEVL
ncbi:hypothetical protein GLOIN_2v1835232 [Rhizophagus irregularis DAOM 181602=DAOM 197198]|uniref:Uncharacterized protein n=1 Tax=Rhizophagus irregularis (strain DAOM 181602 / DAOM 197198 / MUCL 43194) TaxID=747089 RepID=A0A2P4QTS9_RHIID|nr:hypothetical protein GLOIN_2v1835232 [Rhizophagus irregularis DAOM 181602=DAOM 197198]POG81041.1 hypothetical protein GLOIN_2v1835232 [Rhizophagus irregularis DAOM 181602=DAOM 197198]|eukprot:XP_025187907.1 hypothetical protein GLOIN_2v1835232 [Rhizophagus irregularis DAOM 181602=DAOM 197198]